MRIRINNIECRFSQERYEIVKWYPNPHYGAEERYIADGYERVEYKDADGQPRGSWSISKPGHSIHSSCFQNPESCYTIATLRYRSGEGNCDLTTVGDRLLELSKAERNDFFAVYEYAEDRIKEEALVNEEDVEF